MRAATLLPSSSSFSEVTVSPKAPSEAVQLSPLAATMPPSARRVKNAKGRPRSMKVVYFPLETASRLNGTLKFPAVKLKGLKPV
jgi:hypothetical protein